MKKIVLLTIIIPLVFCGGLAFAVIDMIKSYEAGLTAYESNDFDNAMKHLEIAMDMGLSGQRQNEAYVRLYCVSYILGKKDKIRYYEEKCKQQIRFFKPVIASGLKVELRKVDTKNDLTAALKGLLPKGKIIMYQYKVTPELVRKMPFLVDDAGTEIGRYISKVELKRPHDLAIMIGLSKEGGQILKQITEKCLKEKLAFILDDNIIFTPVVDQKITNGQFHIFTDDINFHTIFVSLFLKRNQNQLKK